MIAQDRLEIMLLNQLPGLQWGRALGEEISNKNGVARRHLLKESCEFVGAAVDIPNDQVGYRQLQRISRPSSCSPPRSVLPSERMPPIQMKPSVSLM